MDYLERFVYGQLLNVGSFVAVVAASLFDVDVVVDDVISGVDEAIAESGVEFGAAKSDVLSGLSSFLTSFGKV